MARHTYIEVPEVVLRRQEVLRDARENTHVMFGVPAAPYEFGTPEYDYFVTQVWSEYSMSDYA